ncbi:MAG: hypothetical protein KBT34_02275 [Prevotella sp.]|nr:hypothetical protein [Candidatus Prevotella equi]
MHNSIVRNIIVLLESGAFGTVGGDSIKEESPLLVAMSPHKWRTLIKIAKELNVLSYIAAGADALHGQENLSNAFLENLKEYDVTIRDLDVRDAQLYNHWTSKRLVEVHEEEMNSPNLSEETLNLLDIIIYNADEIITHDVNIEGIIALGVYVRSKKDKIDYEKLSTWLRYVGMVNVASLLGNILIDCMSFKEEELPFVIKPYKKAKNLFMHSLVNALKKHTCSNATRMNIAMLETVSHRFVSAISLVTDIEE